MGALPASAARLPETRGIGPQFATLIRSEGLCRHFDDRRQVAASAGLMPTRWQIGVVDPKRGVSESGNPRLRATMLRLAWPGLRHPPTSASTLRFRDGVARQGGRSRNPAIVAPARRLLVALRIGVAAGGVIAGAATKPA